MGKLLYQVVLLTKKNLKVRFSHRCLTFCELGIPLILTLLLGLLFSYVSRDKSDRAVVDADPIRENSVDSKFQCDQHSDGKYSHHTDAYNCARWYPSVGQVVNDTVYNRYVSREDEDNPPKRVVFVGAKDVGQEFVDVVVKSVLEGTKGAKISYLGYDNEVERTNPLEWEWSEKTERELETCVLQRRPECRDIFAAVVVTQLEDGVQEGNKIRVEYKIRLADSYRSLFGGVEMRDLYLDYSSRYAYHVIATSESLYFPSKQSWSGIPLGFVGLQALVDQGILEFVRNQKGANLGSEKVEISMVRMPFIVPQEDPIAEINQSFSMLYCLLASLAIFSLMRVNTEKSSGFKELLRMHGVTVGTQWGAWFLSSFLVYSLYTLVVTLLLWIPLLGGSNLLGVINVNCILYWWLLLLFMMALTSFSYFISTIFERVWTAASIGLLTWILITVVMMLIAGLFHRLTAGARLVLMLLPTVALDFALRLFLNGGGTLATFAVPVVENVSLTGLHCLVMLLLDSFIYMTLAVYLDNVLPSKYGVSQSPWYIVRDFKAFLVKLTRRRGSSPYEMTLPEGNLLRHSTISLESIHQVAPDGENDTPFQVDPEHSEAAVVLKNLKKRYRNSKTRAVDGITEKMFAGEIYAFLGFNGAGKTTTIGVLTGLSAPTGGWATIFDLDIRKDMEEIRRYTGLCPQHNLLYDEMSVLDQVAFFGRLKGLLDPEEKAKELLTWLGMQEKMDSKPEQLSGGEKRRVHIAIALVGDTKVAFLDEPTSGLDPESRRGVWDILMKLRGKITVILTTHDMEEADVLGDRIGIMSEGKMICSGTSSFLKKYYGVGYNLKMNPVAGHCDPSKILQFAQEYVPTAKLNGNDAPPDFEGEEEKRSNSTLSITLPTAQLDLSRVADLMEAIRKGKSCLGVDDIALSLSTMEQVFLKVGEEVGATSVTVPTCDPSMNPVSDHRYEGRQLERYRFRALVLKRAAYFCHAPFTVALLIVVFAVSLWLSLLGFYSVHEVIKDSDPPRVVSSSSLPDYHSPAILFLHESSSTANVSYGPSYQTQLPANFKTEKVADIKVLPKEDTITDILHLFKTASLEDITHYRQHYLGGASFNATPKGTNITGFFSPYALHSAPLTFNLLTQSRIKALHDVDADIQVINHPMRRSGFQSHSLDHERGRILFYFKVDGPLILLVIVVSLLTSTAAFLPTEERLNKGKQLQLMTGTTPFLYWTSLFAWDFAFFSLANVIITLVYVLQESGNEYGIFTGNGAAVVLYLILEFHTFAALWFSYLVSWATCIKTPSDGFLIVNKFAVIVGIFGNAIRHTMVFSTVVIFDTDESSIQKVLYYLADLLGYILWPVPMHSLYLAMIKLAVVGYENNACNKYPEDVLQLVCDGVESVERSQNETWLIHSCCQNCKENCFQPKSYLTTSGVQLFDGYETHSILFDLFLLLLSGLLSAGLLYFLECQLPRIREKWGRKGSSLSAGVATKVNGGEDSKDEDVTAEANRIEEMLAGNQATGLTAGLVAHNLKLHFGSVKSVDNLTFGVNPGECFGLLGVSGSGKTSTFRVITGDVVPLSGSMYSGGLSYRDNAASYLATMGYCPQFDGIIGRLTGLQMVKLYGTLRGIPPENLTQDARIWLDKFGMLGSANMKCAAYSGGMKRRLSVAMALIGNPKLILLDEPTTGVDPAFRRQFWNVVKELKGKGQSILLTSHTMDECEELCSRLGIMANGQFQCLGTTHHLKKKYGQGYILTIKLTKFNEENESRHGDLVTQLQNRILETFTPCRLQSQQQTQRQYQILNKSLWYSDIFRSMEHLRQTSEVSQVLEEYSVTETTLEDVFISFSRRET